MRVAVEDDARAEFALGLDEICQEGARRMLATALKLEVEAYVAACAEERDDRGHRLVVRNGHAEPRIIATGAGPIEVTVPRVNDKRIDESTGERRRNVEVPLGLAAAPRQSPESP